MNTDEIATGTPDRALLRPAFSVRPSGSRALSENTNRAYLADAVMCSDDVPTLGQKTVHVAAARSFTDGSDLGSVQQLPGRTSLGSARCDTPFSVERLRPAFQQAHPRA